MKYEWKCKECGDTITVERSIAEYNVPPTAEEIIDPCSLCNHDLGWAKVYSSTTPFEHLRDRGVLAR